MTGADTGRLYGPMRLLAGHWQMIALTALVFALWSTPVILPLKILVVFLHELAHGLAALATGGMIEEMTLTLSEGGSAVTRGGNLFAIFSAGYLGSLVLGLVLFFGALRTGADRALMALLGAVMIVIAVLYMRERFALGFTIGTGVVMLFLAWFLPRVVNDLLLRVIGLTSVIYVPFDIFSDTIARAHLRSDARMLAEEFGGTTVLWGGLWLAISLLVIVLCLRMAHGAPSNLTRADLFGRG